MPSMPPSGNAGIRRFVGICQGLPNAKTRPEIPVMRKPSSRSACTVAPEDATPMSCGWISRITVLTDSGKDGTVSHHPPRSPRCPRPGPSDEDPSFRQSGARS